MKKEKKSDQAKPDEILVLHDEMWLFLKSLERRIATLERQAIKPSKKSNGKIKKK